MENSELGDKRLIQSIRLRNLLSFGPDSEEIELDSLNVVIGPNASGKSNLIDAIGLLAAMPTDLAAAIREGGGIADWLWKAAQAPAFAAMECVVDWPSMQKLLLHHVDFTKSNHRLAVTDEAICERLSDDSGPFNPVPFSQRDAAVKFDQSLISQRQGPKYPHMTYLHDQYKQFKLYRDWNVGRRAPQRQPQQADLPEDFLLEDASNLGLVLNNLEHDDRAAFLGIIERMKELYEGISDITVKIQGGTVQLYVHEEGMRQPIPATRLSDGTLKFLCLISVLCHPAPPPLVCIEEPELGLHPDLLPAVASLLVEASHRMQLIVTTHSDILVDALTETPEAILVCEKHKGSTVLRRLSEADLKPWLEKYRLGELWTRGGIGGTRW